MKESIISKLEQIESSLKNLLRTINSINSDFVSRKEIEDTSKDLAKTWFEEIESNLPSFEVDETIIKKYKELFGKLLELGMGKQRKKIYITVINDIISNFRKDLLIPVMKSTKQVIKITQLSTILENVDKDEREYLEEAIGCANCNYFRASVVLAWNAAVHRMHKVVERIGFEEFNKKSSEMKNTKSNRFKRFNKEFNVHSISDLAAVFDTDLLWVLEYMTLIDSNQHQRLVNCFTMRNNCAHPGEALITEANLISFYSDIKNIIFDNEKFKIQSN